MNTRFLELQSDRLLLRPLIEDDLDLVLEMFTNPEVMRYTGGVASEETLTKEMQHYVKRGAGECIGVWCVLRRDTGEKLGSAALLPLPVDGDDTDWALVQEDRYPDEEVEVGYFLKRSARSRDPGEAVAPPLTRERGPP
jgi:RimJ/RimL family protein N-acetyltransferase